MSEQQKRHTLKASSVLVEFSDEMDDWTSEEREFVVKQGVRSYQLLRVAVQAELARQKQEQPLLRQVVYPDWVDEHLTPQYEVKEVCSPGGKVEIWFDPRQKSGNPYPIGYEVYKAIKEDDLLKHSLSLGHLQWYAAHPDQIPAEFKGKFVYAWADVVRSADGDLCVPYLHCNVERPYVDWLRLDYRWIAHEPAGLVS